jgi:HK97 family phage major capsid protein/HK97 family phage prohead protease
VNRAYSLLVIKSVDEAQRIIRGIATTPTPDRIGDVVESEGAEFKLPLPLLSHHDRERPIGHVTKAKVTADGIEIEAQLKKIDEPGRLKDRLDEAWQEIKHGLVRGLSIGFKPIEAARIENTFGLRFLKWMWLELSAVVIPANEDASITAVKSYGDKQAAIGRSVVRITQSPGASGKQSGGSVNIQEHIKALAAQRAAKVAALEAIMTKATDAGETLDAEQQKQFDDTESEIATIDAQLRRAEAMQRIQLSQAKAVTQVEPGDKQADADPTKQAAADRDPTRRVIAVERKLDKGIAFARFAGLITASQGNLNQAADIARDRFPNEKQLHGVLKMIATRGKDWVAKAAVDAGTAIDADYAAPLVNYTVMVQDFIEYLRPQTIIGRIQGLRRVPFNIRVPRQTGGGSASWVGESKPKPVTALAFDFVELKWTKLATIAVITEELARFSSPSAEAIIRDTLAKAIIQQSDADFVDPANAGTANVKPASITNGVSAVTSIGNTEAEIRVDVGNVFAPFIAANLTPANGVWIMSATTALALSLIVNQQGQPAFPGVSMAGGTFFGMPVVVSEAVGNIVILANASDILLADDGQVTIDVSREASVQMDGAPTDPVVAATVLISLWQQNLIGIRAERFINWVKGRAAAVQYLSGVNWGQTTT